MSLSRGSSRLTLRRLCSRAPRMTIWSCCISREDSRGTCVRFGRCSWGGLPAGDAQVDAVEESERRAVGGLEAREVECVAAGGGRLDGGERRDAGDGEETAGYGRVPAA